jgi:Transposase IS66 family.
VVAHSDETGMYVANQRRWLHPASTAQLTHSAYHAKRGSQVSHAIGILPECQGRAIHDGLRSYGQYECAHGLCNAHPLRGLIFAHEQRQRAWAGEGVPG